MVKVSKIGDKERAVLERVAVGAFATLDEYGVPYVVPVHYVLYGDGVYIHSERGRKYYNIDSGNDSVCFTVWDMKGLSDTEHDGPGHTKTFYESVVIEGDATEIDDMAKKTEILTAFRRKYTPQKEGRVIPEKMVERTVVIRIDGEVSYKCR